MLPETPGVRSAAPAIVLTLVIAAAAAASPTRAAQTDTPAQSAEPTASSSEVTPSSSRVAPPASEPAVDPSSDPTADRAPAEAIVASSEDPALADLARDVLASRAHRVPEAPTRDSRGLRMEIWF